MTSGRLSALSHHSDASTLNIVIPDGQSDYSSEHERPLTHVRKLLLSFRAYMCMYMYKVGLCIISYSMYIYTYMYMYMYTGIKQIHVHVRTECRGFESHLRQLLFSFIHCLRCLSFFLSFFLSFVLHLL